MDGKSSSENDDEISVYLDYKWKLSVAQIVVNIPANYRSNTSFKICRGGLDISTGSLHTEINFKGLRLVPPSCHSMQWTCSGELEMRIQAYKQDHGEKKRRQERVLSGDFEEYVSSSGTSPGSSGSDNDFDNRNTPAVKVERICPVDTNVDISMQCSMCGELLVKSQRFSRVLPLPTDNWQDLTDSWFCCQHNHDSNDGSHQPLVPKQRDCLYSDLCVVIHQSSLYLPGVSTSKSGGVLRCTRCRNILGELKKTDNQSPEHGHVVLYRYQVIIEKSSIISSVVDKQIWLHNFELGISNMLLHQVEEQNSFRFVIEVTPSMTPAPFLLIWLMDVNSVKYQGTVNFTQDSKEVLMPKNVAKVMYKDCLKDTGLAKQWRKDLGAVMISLPEIQCTQLLQLLTDRSQTIPLSLRVANDFLVSYLETGLPCPL